MVQQHEPYYTDLSDINPYLCSCRKCITLTGSLVVDHESLAWFCRYSMFIVYYIITIISNTYIAII